MANVTKVPASGGSLDPSNNDRVSAAPKKNFGDLMKIDKTDPEQKKKKQQKGEAEEKRKTETTLAQGEKIHKPSPGTLANFEKKTQKIEKMGESEKRQAKQERRIAEEIEESSNNVALPRTEKLFEISSQESSTDRAISSRKARPSEEPPIEQPSDVEKPEKESASKKIATKKNDPKTQCLFLPILFPRQSIRLTSYLLQVV
jgi:hypothetical protein